MSDILAHDSRDTFFRDPPGARPAGSGLTLRLRAQVEGRAYVRVWWDDSEIIYPMDNEGDGVHSSSIQLPARSGLFWYYFLFESGGKTFRYGNAPDGLGGEGALWGGEPPSYQITVYDPAFSAPEWAAGAVMYQIMPDRFYSSGRNVGAKPGVKYHASWNEPPSMYISDNGDNAADDFFGGDIHGITQKLPYLAGLGVTAIYLNPIFEARSNHKYDTGDYMKVDRSFGTEGDFAELCRAAAELNIRVLLDGVFSHTGSDSRYFNKYGTYGEGGAYRSEASPYSGWYRFLEWPDEYDCWWGVETLPNVNEEHPDYLKFITDADSGVAAHWLKAGGSGWRLDVADELPMGFLKELRAGVKAADRQAALIGEVWEDASNKVTYGQLRSYCLGDTVDGVMNYPLREGIINFMTGQIDAQALARRLNSLYENYPAPFTECCMNILGSHDRPRIINVLSGAEPEHLDRRERRRTELGRRQYDMGVKRYEAAWRFLCMAPGIPCVYYGDEAGMQGGDDPFCRGTYPWGREDAALIKRITRINLERRELVEALSGRAAFVPCGQDVVVAVRWSGGARAACALNRSGDDVRISLPASEGAPEGVEAVVPAQSSVILRP